MNHPNRKCIYRLRKSKNIQIYVLITSQLMLFLMPIKGSRLIVLIFVLSPKFFMLLQNDFPKNPILASERILSKFEVKR